MNRQDIVAAIEAALTETLEREVTGLDEKDRLFEDLELDSTSMLETLMGLEDEVEIEIDPDTLNIEDFQTVGTFIDFVVRERARDGDRVQ